jgi:hypothetical protein
MEGSATPIIESSIDSAHIDLAQEFQARINRLLFIKRNYFDAGITNNRNRTGSGLTCDFPLT